MLPTLLRLRVPIMYNFYQAILLKLLNAIDYKEDKQAFIAEFMQLVSSQALVKLLTTLPPAKQKEADEKIASAQGQDSFQKAVNEYFSKEQIAAAVDEATQNAIVQWIQSLQSTLSAEQKQKLVELSLEMEKQIDAASKA